MTWAKPYWFRLTFIIDWRVLTFHGSKRSLLNCNVGNLFQKTPFFTWCTNLCWFIHFALREEIKTVLVVAPASLDWLRWGWADLEKLGLNVLDCRLHTSNSPLFFRLLSVSNTLTLIHTCTVYLLFKSGGVFFPTRQIRKVLNLLNERNYTRYRTHANVQYEMFMQFWC